MSSDDFNSLNNEYKGFVDCKGFEKLNLWKVMIRYGVFFVKLWYEKL